METPAMTENRVIPWEKLAGWLFLSIIVLVPLPLGAARPWSAAALTIALAVTMLIWSGTRLVPGAQRPTGSRYLILPLLLLGGVVLWGVAQTLPILPDPWAHPLWREAETVLGPLPQTVSLTPVAGRDAIMRFLAYAMAFLLAYWLGRDRHFAWLLISAMAAAAAIYGAYGLYNVLSGMEKIGWMDKTAYRGMVTGTLVNANHFATLLGIGLLCAIARLNRSASEDSRKRRGAAWVWRGAVLAILAALVMTHSRGGAIASAIGLLVLLVTVAWRTHDRRIAWAIIILLSTATLVIAMLDDRLTQSWAEAAADRFQLYDLTADLIAQRPLLGTGLGSFMDAFATIRPVGMVQNWNAAHNVYLELALELGLPATAAWLAGLLLLIRRSLHGLLHRQRTWLICALSFSASILIAAHSMVDFSTQIPAVATWWSVLLGLGMALSRSTAQD